MLKPVACALDLGFARSGNMQIELMQPLSSEGNHFEFLAAHGELGGVDGRRPRDPCALAR